MASAPPDTVIGDLVVLRRENRADAVVVAELVATNLDRLAEFMPWAVASSASLQVQLNRIMIGAVRWETGDEFDYVITVDEAIVGKASLRRLPAETTAMEIGYWIDEASEGHGFMTAAVEVLTEVALELDGVDCVEIHCDATNVRSAAVARRNGYTLERTERSEIVTRAQTGVSQVWVFRRS